MSTPLQINDSEHGRYRLLHLSGKLDTETSTTMLEKLEQLIADGANHIILDFAGITYVSSAGIGAVVRASALCEKGGGELVNIAIDDKIMSVLTILGVANSLTIKTSLAQVDARN